MEKSISEKVFEEIRGKKISPKAKWRFLLCRISIIFLLIFCVLAGAVSLGVILSLFSQFDIGQIIHRPRGIRILFLSLPFAWIFLVGIFSILAIVEFAKTRSGYKYKTRNVVGIFSLVIIVLGFFLYFSTFSDRVENYLENSFSTYRQIIKTPRDVWSQPKEGLLSGVIILDDERVCHCLSLKDWEGEVWEVQYEKALIRSRVRKDKGEMIKILGDDLGEHKFKAQEIRPWNGRQANREK